MKKILSVLLSVLFIFFTGCSTITDYIDNTANVEGFYELDIPMEYLQFAFSLRSDGDILSFCTYAWVDDEGNFKTPHGEDEIEGLSSQYYIIKYDAKKNKLLGTYLIEDCPFDDIWGIEIDGENTIIFNEHEHINAIYDKDMKFIEKTQRPENDCREIAKKSKFYSDGQSSSNDGYTYISGSGNMQYTYFHDDIDTIYLYDPGVNHQIGSIYMPEDYLLKQYFDNDNLDKVDLRVEDYKNAVEINRAVIDKGERDCNLASLTYTAIGEKYVFALVYFSNEGDSNSIATMQAWNYTCNPTNKPIDCKSYNSSQIDEMFSGQIDSIRNDYNIDVHINEMNDNIEGNVECKGELDSLIVYDDLRTIRKFLDSLPDGMVKEIYSGFYDKENEREGIRLDIVSEVTLTDATGTGDSPAFANRYTEPMMELCFEYNCVSMSDLAHEFMHLFNARIDDYINHTHEFENEWENMNKPYEHEYIFDEDYKGWYDFDESNFISSYAAANDDEDTAEMFSYIYNDFYPNEDLSNREGVMKKKELLLELIRKAFPSVQRAESVCWENN